MALVLFTGVPKSGKTLFAVTKLVNLLKTDGDRAVYSDINGLAIAGVQPPPNDWTTLPDGSLVIYDEVQYREPYKRARGATPHQYILDLTTHAHRGFDIWLITQSPTFLHTDVRECVTDHYHLTRSKMPKLSHYIHWNHCEKSPNGTTARREYVSKGLVRHDQAIFDLYKSVQVDDDIAHHKKFEMTSGMYLYGGIFLLCFAFIFYNRVIKDNDIKPDVAQVNQVQHVEQANNSQLAQTEQLQPEQLEATRVAFVISSDAGCTAKNSKGVPIDMPHNECMLYSDNPSMIAPSYVQAQVKSGFYHGNLPPIDLTNQSNNHPEPQTIQQPVDTQTTTPNTDLISNPFNTT